MKKGWYPDPRDPERYRWWNGQSWTQDTRTLEEAKQYLQEEGEEIELEQGARDAIERRRQALHEAGKRFQEEGIRARRRKPVEPADDLAEELEAEDPEEPAENLSGSDDGLKPEAPRFTESSKFPDIENVPQASTEFPDFFAEETAAEETTNEKPEEKRRTRTAPRKKSATRKNKRSAKSRGPKAGDAPSRRKASAKKKSPKREGASSALSAISGVALAGASSVSRVISLVFKEATKPFSKKEHSSEEEWSPGNGFSTRRLLIVLGPVALIILVAGLLVWLPGESDGPRQDLVVGKPETVEPAAEEEKKTVDPAVQRAARIRKCIESSPGVNSFVREDVSGEDTWKIIFVDDNYELVTVTEKSSPAAAKQEAQLSSTSFIASAGGRFMVLGPLRGIEGSGIKASRAILSYINSLSSCLGRIR